MSRFFIGRPVVAMVISILMVILGIVTILGLPVSLFPDITPPEIQISTTFVGADAQTVAQSVATPIEEQISGVEGMLYMNSINMSSGQMKLYVDFDVASDPNIDLMLTQIRQNLAGPQLPQPVKDYGVSVMPSTRSPLMLVSLYSPKRTYDASFLANYIYINLNDPITRLPGVGSVQVFGAGQFAIRVWIDPAKLASLGVSVSDVTQAINQQNKVSPVGQVGGEPAPPGQEFTYSVKTQGRLVTADEFADIALRANPDGSILRIRDVARVELGVQSYNIQGRLNGAPSALIAVYQLPGSNAVTTGEAVRELVAKAAERFPADMAYSVSLDTTLAVTAGINEIANTLWQALLLVIVVVFVFLQTWRATLIPLLAVPVALIGTFVFFPLLGFSINTLSLLGLVLAIGLVVDDAIVVVEAVERHIEDGLSPRDAALKAMSEVSGPVVAIAVILAAVFIPTAFIPGITGRLYQPFAVTIALSVVLSAFNALSLSPALAALLLRPKAEQRGLLARMFAGFNRGFERLTDRYVGISGYLIRRSARTVVLLAALAAGAGFLGWKLPGGFLPVEDQGYAYINVQLPFSSSLQRTGEVCGQIEQVLAKTPGVASYNTVVGFSLLSMVQATYSGFFFVTFEPWDERKAPDEQLRAIMTHIYAEISAIPEAIAFPFLPPEIPGVGTASGATFMLEDRSGGTVDFLAEQTTKFMDELRKRPEVSTVFSTALLAVPQLYVDVDRDKVFRQGVSLEEVDATMQVYLGGSFVNYFNRFGRQWQVYVQAEGDSRNATSDISSFYVRNRDGQMVPLSALATVKRTVGPEFTMHFNEFNCSQVNCSAAPGYTSGQVMQALEETFAQTMPPQMGYDYSGMSYQERIAAQGVPPAAIFGLSLLFVFLILAALYESWSLPFSVLLCTPIAVLGAFLALYFVHGPDDVYAQIGLVMLIGLSAKNAILIVEFANAKVAEGKPFVDAALEGARLRLRPILMTALAFILGCVPLLLASGSGANSRHILGIVVIGGMLTSTCIAIFIIPVMFAVVSRLGGARRMPAAAAPDVPDGELQR